MVRHQINKSIHSRNKQISRELTVIEKRLSKRLEGFYNNYIRDSLTPIEILEQKDQYILYHIIKRAVQDAYMFASDHVDPNSVVILTQIDYDNIERISQEQVKAFWKTMARLKQRQILVETEQEFKNRMASLGLFDSIAAMIGQAAQTVFKAFNTGIKSKVSQLSSAFDVGDIDIDQAFKPVSGKVKFMTAGDAKVDPVFCEPLDGNVYEATDPDIPEPPLHLHCRCRLVPLLENE